MDAITSATLLKAMDGLSLRMTAIAENIANASTPHYRPMRVKFEEALKAAESQGADAVSLVKPSLFQEPGAEARGSVRLDMELAASAATSGRYATLAELLGRELQMTSLAISGGHG